MHRKMFAFAVAFFFTLTVALVPLGIAGLPNADPRPPNVAEAVPATYDYRIMPGFIPGEEWINPLLYLRSSNAGDMVIKDNDGGRWLDSRISNADVVVGTNYTIEATTFEAPATGTFAMIISTCAENEDYCPKENWQSTSSCARDLLTIKFNRIVHLTDEWTERCKAKKYTFTPDENMKITIDLMGLADASHLPEKLKTPDPLTVTCGWHPTCNDNFLTLSDTRNSGIDFSTLDGRDYGDGTSVYLVIETRKDSKQITASVMPVPHPAIGDGTCKRVDVVIAADEVTIAVLRYTHVVALPDLLAPKMFSPPTKAVKTTVIEIGKIAMWPGRGGEAGMTEHPGCGSAAHLHQGIHRSFLSDHEFGWRNYDKLDKRGLPGHQRQGFCIWSDTWVHAIAIQRHPTDKPKPTDRSKHGPNDTPHCPLRFFGTIADQSWASGQAVSLTAPEAKGGNGSLTYSLQDCPHGLSIDSSSRVISGTPSSAASGTCKVMADDPSSVPSTTLSFDYKVRGGGSPATARDTSPSFPSGTTIDEQRWTQNSAITAFTLPTAEGGNSPLSYSLNEDFPDNVDVGDNHRVSGTPEQAMARKEYTWTATDADGDTASITFFVTIAAEPTTEPTEPTGPTTGCTLTVVASPAKGGNTTPSAGTYRYSSCPPSKNLMATAKPGYRFSSWSGASGTSANTNVTLKDGDNKTVTAKFVQEHTLTVRMVPTSCKRSVSNNGITRDKGSEVSFGVSWTANCRFVGWSSGVTDIRTSTSDRSSSGKIVLSSDRTVTATLSKIQYALTVEANPSSCGTTGGSDSYDAGTEATVSVEWNAGCSFTGWSSGVSGIKTNYRTRTSSGKVTVNRVMTVTATLSKNVYTLTTSVSPGGAGAVSVSPAGPYHYGVRVTLTASPARLYYLQRWAGAAATGTVNEASVTIRGNTIVTAYFRYVCNDHSHGYFGPCLQGAEEPEPPP